MTTTVSTVGAAPEQIVGLPCALRRGELDERDRALCSVIWEFCDKHGYGPSMKHLEAMTGVSLNRVHARLTGRLMRYGWVTMGEPPDAWSYAPARSLRPGPRFVALMRTRNGERWPMEWSS